MKCLLVENRLSQLTEEKKIEILFYGFAKEEIAKKADKVYFVYPLMRNLKRWIIKKFNGRF